jgi:hypothetical protein
MAAKLIRALLAGRAAATSLCCRTSEDRLGVIGRDGARHSLIVSVASAKTDSMRGKQKTTTGRDTMMRMPIIVLLIIAAALLGKTQVSSAQSAYSYPWCAIYFSGGNTAGGSMSCYYTSWEQCRATMLGVGGNCIESPYYHAQSRPLPSLVKPRHHRHARTAGARE